jgi:hypothetical protein
MIRSLTLAMAAALVASCPHAQETKPSTLTVAVPTFQNVNCPIMGKPTSTALFVDTPKGRIYTCCVPCNAKIRKDPDTAHKAAYPRITKLDNKICPVTANAIQAGSPTLVLQGYELSVCSNACIPAAQDNSQIVLTKLLNPKVRDLGNAVCPLTGKAVEKNAFVLIGDDLIRLSSTRCVDIVRQAPEEALRKAKESADGGKPGAETRRER